MVFCFKYLFKYSSHTLKQALWCRN